MSSKQRIEEFYRRKKEIEDYLNGRTPEQKDNRSGTVGIIQKRNQTGVDEWVQ